MTLGHALRGAEWGVGAPRAKRLRGVQGSPRVAKPGSTYLVMEYLEGETIAARLTKGPLPTDQVLRYATEIADALDKAHRKGITHRDLKPGNIMITKAGTKLLDFGLAKLRDPKTTGLSLSQRPTQSASLLRGMPRSSSCSDSLAFRGSLSIPAGIAECAVRHLRLRGYGLRDGDRPEGV